jgi:hypothetical protein
MRFTSGWKFERFLHPLEREGNGKTDSSHPPITPATQPRSGALYPLRPVPAEEPKGLVRSAISIVHGAPADAVDD